MGPSDSTRQLDSALRTADEHLLQGRPAEAGLVYADLCRRRPADAGLRLRWALSLEQSEQWASCERVAREALALERDLLAGHLCLGTALLAQKRPDEARATLRDALRIDGSSLDVRFRLGQAELAAGDSAAAVKVLTGVVAQAPRAAEVHEALGLALAAAGQLEAAVLRLQRAVELTPEHAERWRHLGTLYVRLGRHAEAERAYARCVTLRPDQASHWNNLGAVSRLLGRSTEALRAFQRALELEPGRPRTLANVARVLLDQGRDEQARELLLTAVAGEPGDSSLRLELARAQLRCHDVEAAERTAREVLDLEPAFAPALECLASTRLVRGQTCASLDLYEQALAADPDLAAPYYRLARGWRSPGERLQLHFALGHVYEGAGDFARAYDHFRRGNELKQVSFEPAAFVRRVDEILASFSAPAADGIEAAPGARSPRPIFIVGMIRSGTSLVEQILSSHPAVFATGESTTLESLLARTDLEGGGPGRYPTGWHELDAEARERLRASYLAEQLPHLGQVAHFTDKTPSHFLHLGAIAELFPDARIVHCVRDPRDACLSAYLLNFSGSNAPYAYDPEHLALVYAQYRRVMAHWREHLPLDILDVNYEDLVASTRAGTERLLEHCGLPFDERCLRFHESERAVFTASTSQVREPAHERSIGRWKSYEPYLGGLFAALRS